MRRSLPIHSVATAWILVTVGLVLASAESQGTARQVLDQTFKALGGEERLTAGDERESWSARTGFGQQTIERGLPPGLPEQVEDYLGWFAWVSRLPRQADVEFIGAENSVMCPFSISQSVKLGIPIGLDRVELGAVELNTPIPDARFAAPRASEGFERSRQPASR